MGLIKNLFAKKEKSDAELKVEVLKKATEHWNANSEQDEAKESESQIPKPVYEDISQVKKKNIRTVLLDIAGRGEAGVLSTSISDKAGLSQQETAAALTHLTNKTYVEAVNSHSGMKYYLSAAGKKYCLSKEFNSVS